jgi:hypothetical protein
VTEDEAKTKWCPFARISSPIYDKTRTWGGHHPKIGAETANRGAREEQWPLCIGSACMAWRWAGYRAADGTWVRKTAAGEGPFIPEKADGFCGLAGAPQ